MDQTDLREIIRLEQSRVKASREKCNKLECRGDITKIEKRSDKRKKKFVVRKSERRVRKVVWSRVEQAVYYRTMQSENKIRWENVDKKRWQSTLNNGK